MKMYSIFILIDDVEKTSLGGRFSHVLVKIEVVVEMVGAAVSPDAVAPALDDPVVAPEEAVEMSYGENVFINHSPALCPRWLPQPL